MYRDDRMAQYLCAAALTCLMGNKSADHMRRQLFDGDQARAADLSDFWYDMASAVHQVFSGTLSQRAEVRYEDRGISFNGPQLHKDNDENTASP